MPTKRPRHFVTESDELVVALDQAARRWPGLSRGQLLARLALEGHRLLEGEAAQMIRRRRAAAARAGTILSGTGARAELERMREEEWPA